MPTGQPLTDSAVHRAVWANASRNGLVRLNQKELASQFGVTKFTMSRKIRSLLEAGRLRQVSNKKNNTGKFVVADPDDFPDHELDNWLDEEN